MRIAWLLIGWSIIGAIFYLSVLAPYIAPNLGNFDHQDKIYHFSAYFGLMYWFAQLYQAKHRWILALAIFAFGMVIELVQPYTGRDFDLLDMLANGSGVVLAWFTTIKGGDIFYRKWFSEKASTD